MSVHPREKILRVCLATALVATPLAVATKLLPFVPYFVGVVAVAVCSASGGVTLAFYAIWTVGWLTEMEPHSSTLLIGEKSFDVPQPYFPWSRRIKTLRRRKRIEELERSVGLAPNGMFYNR